MKITYKDTKEFADFKHELKDRLNKRNIKRLENPAGYRPSAVNVLLMNKKNRLHVLLTKRSDNVSAHKGEISFPGGSYDDEDGSLQKTVYRETYEEVGIPPEKIECMGRFDDYLSLYGFHVSCFIGVIPYPFSYKFNTDEIDDYVEAPMSLFLERAYDALEEYVHNNKRYDVYYYYYEGHKIWGLTARILTDFSQAILLDS